MYKYTQMLSQAYRCNNVQTDISHIQHKRNIVPRKGQNNLNYEKISFQNQKSCKENQYNYPSSKQPTKIVNKKFEVPNRKVIQPNNDRNNIHQQRVQQISSKYSHQSQKDPHNNYQIYKQTKAQFKRPELQKDTEPKNQFQKTYMQMIEKDKNIQRQSVYHNNSIPFSEQMSKGKVKGQIALRLQNLKKSEQKDGPDKFSKKYDYGCVPQAGPHSFKQNPSNSSQTMTKLSLLQERIKQTIEPYKNL